MVVATVESSSLLRKNGNEKISGTRKDFDGSRSGGSSQPIPIPQQNIRDNRHHDNNNNDVERNGLEFESDQSSSIIDNNSNEVMVTGTEQLMMQQPQNRDSSLFSQDFTVPTSNLNLSPHQLQYCYANCAPQSLSAASLSPLLTSTMAPNNDAIEDSAASPNRRSIFSNRARRNYRVGPLSDQRGRYSLPADGETNSHMAATPSSSAACASPAINTVDDVDNAVPLPAYQIVATSRSRSQVSTLSTSDFDDTGDGPISNGWINNAEEDVLLLNHQPLNGDADNNVNLNIIDGTNDTNKTTPSKHQKDANHRSVYDSLLVNTSTSDTNITASSSSKRSGVVATRTPRYHETTHAQSLLIGLTFLCIWSPSNLMAPHLTDMATFFGFTDSVERDLYLGSYCALVTGVFSLPLAALVGFLADAVTSRRYLFGATALVTGGASLAAGCYVHNYRQLLICRLLQGGGMGGSVPVAFSFLGDLFSAEERNTASSGLTAMMGLGIILGQVGAGLYTGHTPGHNWQAPFQWSGAVTCVMAVVCVYTVREPVRGGKEPVLQDLLKSGTRYERQLSWDKFWDACLRNASNRLLLWQGFFSSLPWGVIFVFLNDFLSQERGFSIPDATYLVLLFGLGCAVGGILGGYWGQIFQSYERSYLPIFMGVTTMLGMLPFWALLNSSTTNAHGWRAVLYSFGGGLVASLPSVNVRPCLLNVNPPETRGASLTAANLLINIGRGVGPSCVTLMGTIGGVDRRCAFNVTIGIFWAISALQLFMLAKTLPRDQDAMEAELALYAAEALEQHRKRTAAGSTRSQDFESLEESISTWDGQAARETITYVRKGVEEMNHVLPFHCGPEETSSSSSDEDDVVPMRDVRRWRRHRQEQEAFSDAANSSIAPPSETTSLVGRGSGL